MRAPTLMLFATMLTLGAGSPGVSQSGSETLEPQTYSLRAVGGVRVEAVSLPIQEAIAFQASLHLSNEVEPGEYEIEEGFFDVGPNAVPVSAMAVAVSPDRSFQRTPRWCRCRSSKRTSRATTSRRRAADGGADGGAGSIRP